VQRTTRPLSEKKDGERGQALVVFVLSAVVLFGMTALAIDVGSILHERRDLQNAADAASLAGALELPQDPVLAELRAQEWAQNNGVDVAGGDSLDVSISADNTSVAVEVKRDASFIFGRVLGLTTVEAHADATARTGSPANLAGVLPFGVLESAINYDGIPTVIKYDASNPTNGNFAPLRIDGNGSAVHEESIINGSTTMICGASQPTCTDPTQGTQTGNLVGATRDGLRYRFTHTSPSCDQFNEVLTVNQDGSYKVLAPCNPFTENSDSLLLVLIPVIDAFPQGASEEVTVLYFTGIFLNEINQCTGVSCEVTGTFVKVVADPTTDADLGIYDPTSGVKFVRLVD